MRKWGRHAPLSGGPTLLLATFVVVNLAVLGLTVGSLKQTQRQHTDEAIKVGGNLARALSIAVGEEFEHADLALARMRDEFERELAGGALSRPKFLALMDGTISTESAIDGLWLIDTHGAVRFGTGRVPDPRTEPPREDYFARVRDDSSGGRVFCGLVRVAGTGRPSICLATRLNDAAGRFAGAAFAAIDTEYLEKMFAEFDVGTAGVALLLHADRAVIASSQGEDLTGAQDAMMEAATLRGQLDTLPRAGVAMSMRTGIEQVTAYRRLEHDPFYVAIVLSSKDYLADWRREAVQTALFESIFFASTLLASWLLFRSWVRGRFMVGALAKQQYRFRELLESARDAVVICDARGTIAAVNRYAEAMFGFGRDELLGQAIEILLPASARSRHSADVAAYAAEGYPRRMAKDREFRLVDRHGRQFDAIINLMPTEAEQGTMIAAVIHDVTEEKAARRQIEFLAHHDPLTGLLNRVAFGILFQQALARAERNRSRLALIILDIDDFKAVNDTLGHVCGDELLRQVAERLRAALRASDTVARHGGDELLILVADATDPDAIERVVRNLMQCFEAPFTLDSRQARVTVSAGVAVYPEDAADFETLYRRGDIALYRAKSEGRSTYRFFEPYMDADPILRFELSNDLAVALEHSQFVLHYQPQIHLATGAVRGVEALLRWNHPKRGLIAPGTFIGAAESSGLICPIGEWVLREACQQARKWHNEGIGPLVVAVNVSAVQLMRGDFEQIVQDALERSGLEPRWLELEITESTLVRDAKTISGSIQRLRSIGVRLSIDDFGTGYSSLAYLRRFPVNRIKIAGAFLHRAAQDHSDRAIVRAIVRLGKGLGIETLAEGVEDKAVAALMRRLQCDEAQGYFFAHPMPSEEISVWMATAASGGATVS